MEITVKWDINYTKRNAPNFRRKTLKMKVPKISKSSFDIFRFLNDNYKQRLCLI